MSAETALTVSDLEDIRKLPSDAIALKGNSLGDAEVVEIASLRSLRELDLSGCEDLTDYSISALHRVSSLELLDLSFCNQITDSSLKALAALPVLPCRSTKSEAKATAVYSVARGGRGLVAMVGSAGEYKGTGIFFIALYPADGSVRKVIPFPVDVYNPFAVAVTEDGSVWTAGEPKKKASDHNIFWHFDCLGNKIGSAVDINSFSSSRAIHDHSLFSASPHGLISGSGNGEQPSRRMLPISGSGDSNRQAGRLNDWEKPEDQADGRMIKRVAQNISAGNLVEQGTDEMYGYYAENRQTAFCTSDSSPPNCVQVAATGRTLYYYDGDGTDPVPRPRFGSVRRPRLLERRRRSCPPQTRCAWRSCFRGHGVIGFYRSMLGHRVRL